MSFRSDTASVRIHKGKSVLEKVHFFPSVYCRLKKGIYIFISIKYLEFVQILALSFHASVVNNTTNTTGSLHLVP